MASIKVIIYDPTGSKKTPVELPEDVPMRRLIPALVSKMGLPTTQGANPIAYRLDHRSSGKRLSDNGSLADAGVTEDDITAKVKNQMIEQFTKSLIALSQGDGVLQGDQVKK